MSYEKIVSDMKRYGVTPEVVGDWIADYAIALKDAEPAAQSSIAAARETADAFRFDLEGE